MGVYGEGFLSGFPPSWKNRTVENAWKLAYEDEIQRVLSPANLWHDPHHEREYVEGNLFLPKSLNLDGKVERNVTEERKRNFLGLNRAVFLVGKFETTTYDLGIDPWFSGVFDYYDGQGRVVDMTEQAFYVRDTFGLKSMHESGRLVRRAVPGVLHDDWLYDPYVVRHFVLPYLTKNGEAPNSLRGAATEEATVQVE